MMSSESKEDPSSTPPNVEKENDINDDDDVIGNDNEKIENENEDEKDEKDEKLPKPDKPAAANETAKESDKESVNDKSEKSDSEDEEEEESMGLLDRPVEITGSRERKKVQRLELSFATPSKDKLEIPDGSGQKLGDCPRIEYHIQKNPFADLKALHKILFNRPGSGNEIKKNIRKFSGFTFSHGSQEFDKKKSLVEKQTSTVLKHVCEVLDLERGGTKDEIVLRLIEFLLDPKDSGKKVPAAKKRSNRGGDKKKGKDKKSASTPKKVKGKKNASSAEESESAPEESDHATSDDVKDESMSEDNDEKPKKKAKAAAPKKTPISAKGKKGDKSSEKPKKEEKKATSKAVKRKRGEDSGESSDDDEPLAKKNKMPSDDELKKLVKKILEAADLQEITMKKVIKQVADTYPDCDLSGKKDFIKATVKSVIS